jgi:hypothetical protein
MARIGYTQCPGGICIAKEEIVVPNKDMYCSGGAAGPGSDPALSVLLCTSQKCRMTAETTASYLTLQHYKDKVQGVTATSRKTQGI